MDSIYLSPGHIRVPLATEDDVESALGSELLEEGHFLDLKREVKAGKAQNKETARDLAQFAIDGGTVLVGIDELDDGTLSRTPQPLHGLAERIEQIATMGIDPPLAVITQPIPTEADRSVGYLVVHVPASPMAPHMVDGRYLARGDKTKRYLTDPEVLRLHALRSANELDALKLLEVEFERDVFASVPVGNAHGFFLAEPVTGRLDMLLPLTGGSDHQALHQLTNTAVQRSRSLSAGSAGTGGFRPDLSEFTSFDRRPSAMALTSYGIAPGRLMRQSQGRYDDREAAGEIELQDNGGLRIYTGRLSYVNSDDQRIFIDPAAVGLAHGLVALAQGVADESRYFGNWVLAAGGTRLRGTYSSVLAMSHNTNSPFPDETYKRAVTASYADLTQRPRELVDKLVGNLLRGLQSRKFFLSALETPGED